MYVHVHKGIVIFLFIIASDANVSPVAKFSSYLQVNFKLIQVNLKIQMQVVPPGQ